MPTATVDNPPGGSKEKKTRKNRDNSELSQSTECKEERQGRPWADLRADVSGNTLGQGMGVVLAAVMAQEAALLVHKVEEDGVVHQVVLVLVRHNNGQTRQNEGEYEYNR